MAKGEKIYLATKQELNEVAANAGTKIQEVTQAAYDALSEEDKNKSDVIYKITDKEASQVFISTPLGETSDTAYAGNKGKALADKVGSTDISNVGDGTITGAIKTLSEDDSVALGETSDTAYAGDKGKALADKIGSTDITSISSTITSAISTLNSNNSNTRNMISDAWSSSVTYGVNAYCIYNNSMYKCKVQHSNQTPTNTTYWTKVTIGSEMNELETKIASKISPFGTYVGTYSPGTWGTFTHTLPSAGAFLMVTCGWGEYGNTFLIVNNPDHSNCGVSTIHTNGNWTVTKNASNHTFTVSCASGNTIYKIYRIL